MRRDVNVLPGVPLVLRSSRHLCGRSFNDGLLRNLAQTPSARCSFVQLLQLKFFTVMVWNFLNLVGLSMNYGTCWLWFKDFIPLFAQYLPLHGLW